MIRIRTRLEIIAPSSPLFLKEKAASSSSRMWSSFKDKAAAVVEKAKEVGASVVGGSGDMATPTVIVCNESFPDADEIEARFLGNHFDAVLDVMKNRIMSRN